MTQISILLYGNRNIYFHACNYPNIVIYNPCLSLCDTLWHDMCIYISMEVKKNQGGYKMKLKPGEVEIKLHLQGEKKDIQGLQKMVERHEITPSQYFDLLHESGDRLVTDGNTFTVYNPDHPDGEVVDKQRADVILQKCANVSIADLAVILMSPTQDSNL